MYGYSLALLIFVVAPLIVVVPMSLTSGNTLAFPTPGYSLRWFAEIWADGRWLASFWNSIVVAVSTMLLSTILGIPAAIALTWGNFPGKRIIYMIVAAPLIMPVVIVAVASFFFFSSLGLAGNKLSIILTHTTMAAPVMLITVVANLRNFDRTLLRASASLGAGKFRTFFKVLLPLIAPGVAAGGIIAFLISFDEVVVASFLSVGEQRTLPRMIFSGVRESISPAIAAVALLLILFSTVLLVVVGFLQARSQKLRTKVLT